MGQTTISPANVNKPAPKWFRKLKRAYDTLLAPAALAILGAFGELHNFNTVLLALIIKVGVSAVFGTLEIFLSNGQEYTDSQPENT